MKVEIKQLGGETLVQEVEPCTSVKELKEKVAPALSVGKETITLIFKGRIAKDGDTMESLRVTDGAVVHLVSRKATAAAQAPTSAPASAASNTAPTAPATGGATTSATNPNVFNPAAGFPGTTGGMFPGMDGLPNPQALASLMSNPQMQQMMQSLMQNPDMMIRIMQNNPLLRTVSEGNPALRQMFEDPQALRQMFSPEIMQNVANMLQTGVPGFPGGAGAGTGAGAMPDLNNLSSMLGGAGGMDFSRLGDPSQLRNLMQNFGGADGQLGSLLNPGSTAATSTIPPEERYKAQLTQLEDMGFLGKDANISALTESNGNIDAAIQLLLERGFGN